MTQDFLFDPYREEMSGQKSEQDQQRDKLGFEDASDEDLVQLSHQKQLILRLIRDRWKNVGTLIAETGASSAGRRVRELRAEGYEILKRGSGRDVEYRWTGRYEEGVT